VNVASYVLAGFSYAAADRTATWTLASSVGVDKILLDLDGDAAGAAAVTDVAGNRLDGEWTDGADTFPSGDGTAGGDFRFGLHVMPGDADGNGTTNVSDLGTLATHFNRNPRDHTQGDFNGDAVVDVSDLGTLATNFNRSLPAGNPAVVAARVGAFSARGIAVRPAVGRPIAALFGTVPSRRQGDRESDALSV
jgi:hypothetical protein